MNQLLEKEILNIKGGGPAEVAAFTGFLKGASVGLKYCSA